MVNEETEPAVPAPQTGPEVRGTSITIGSEVSEAALTRLATLNGYTTTQQIAALVGDRQDVTKQIIRLEYDATGEDILEAVLDAFTGDTITPCAIMNCIYAFDIARASDLPVKPYGKTVSDLVARMSNDVRVLFFEKCNGLTLAHNRSMFCDDSLELSAFESNLGSSATVDLENVVTIVINVYRALMFEILRQPTTEPQPRRVLVYKRFFDDDDEAEQAVQQIKQLFNIVPELVDNIVQYLGDTNTYVYCPKNKMTMSFITAQVNELDHDLLSGHGEYLLCGFQGIQAWADSNLDLAFGEVLEPSKGKRKLFFTEPDEDEAAVCGGTAQRTFPEFIGSGVNVFFARSAKPVASVEQMPSAPQAAAVYPSLNGIDTLSNPSGTNGQKYQHPHALGRVGGRQDEQYTNLHPQQRTVRRVDTPPPQPQQQQDNSNPAPPASDPNHWSNFFTVDGSGSAAPPQPHSVPGWNQPLIEPPAPQPLPAPIVQPNGDELFGGIQLRAFDKNVQSLLLSLTNPEDKRLVNQAFSRMFSGVAKDKLATEADLGRASDKVRQYRLSIASHDTRTLRRACMEGVTRGRYYSKYLDMMARKLSVKDPFVVLITAAVILQTQVSMVYVRDGDTVLPNM